MVTYSELGNTLLKGLVVDMLLTFAGLISRFFTRSWFFTGDYAMRGLVIIGKVGMLDGNEVKGTDGWKFWYDGIVVVRGFFIVGMFSTLIGLVD